MAHCRGLNVELCEACVFTSELPEAKSPTQTLTPAHGHIVEDQHVAPVDCSASATADGSGPPAAAGEDGLARGTGDVQVHVAEDGSIMVSLEHLQVLDACVRRVQAESSTLAEELAKIRSHAATVPVATPCGTDETKRYSSSRSIDLVAGTASINSVRISTRLSMQEGEFETPRFQASFRETINLAESLNEVRTGLDSVTCSLRAAAGTTSKGLFRALFVSDFPKDCVVHVISKMSWEARISLFLGGFGIMPCPALQNLYDIATFLSYMVCLAGCLANTYYQTPPHNDWALVIVNIWFHLFGLHAWTTWKTFGCWETPRLEERVDNHVTWSYSLLGRTAIHRQFRILLACQIAAVIIGYIAQPMPAWFYFQTAPKGLGEGADGGGRLFSLLHAASMWAALPQLVPSVVVGIGLFNFVCDVHARDAWRMLKRVQTYTPSGGASPKFGNAMAAEVIDCCEAAESLQDRLTYTCRHLSLLWIHMVVYAAISILSVVSRVKKGRSQQDIDLDVRISRIAYVVFIGAFGIALFGTALLKPAHVSRVFDALPRNVCKAMRVREVSIPNISAAIDFLQVEAVGYRIGTFQINEKTTGHFASVLSVLVSLAFIDDACS